MKYREFGGILAKSLVSIFQRIYSINKGPTQITRAGPSLPFEPAGIYRMSVNFFRIFLLSASMR